MHLADGILTSPELIAGASLLGLGGVGVAIERSARARGAGAAWTGTLASFAFVAQAINVPAVPGASAHALGACLLTLAVGPAAAVVALAAVVIVQALLLGDGGIVVLGVNLLNLAVLPPLAVAVVRRLAPSGRAGLLATAVAGTLLGHLAAAASLGGLLVAGAGAPPGLTFAWLLGVQAIAGLAEGALTAAVVARLWRRAPALLSPPDLDGEARRGAPNRGALAWAAVAVGIALLALPFTSPTPDALERVVDGGQLK